MVTYKTVNVEQQLIIGLFDQLTLFNTVAQQLESLVTLPIWFILIQLFFS